MNYEYTDIGGSSPFSQQKIIWLGSQERMRRARSCTPPHNYFSIWSLLSGFLIAAFRKSEEQRPLVVWNWKTSTYQVKSTLLDSLTPAAYTTINITVSLSWNSCLAVPDPGWSIDLRQDKSTCSALHLKAQDQPAEQALFLWEPVFRGNTVFSLTSLLYGRSFFETFFPEIGFGGAEFDGLRSQRIRVGAKLVSCMWEDILSAEAHFGKKDRSRKTPAIRSGLTYIYSRYILKV